MCTKFIIDFMMVPFVKQVHVIIGDESVWHIRFILIVNLILHLKLPFPAFFVYSMAPIGWFYGIRYIVCNCRAEYSFFFCICIYPGFLQSRPHLPVFTAFFASIDFRQYSVM